MQDESKTRAQLVDELAALRQRVTELEALEIERQQAALALENARRAERAAAQQHADRLALLNRIGLTITSGLDMQRVLQSLHEQCQQVLAIDVFSVALYNEQTGLIHFPLFCDRGEYHTGMPRNIRDDPGLTGYVLQTRQTLHVPDALAPDYAPPVPIIRLGGIASRAYVGVPLMFGDKVIGVMAMQSYQPNAYSPDDVRLLETIATQAAIAIENAQLFEETRHRAEQMTTLNLIGLNITSGLDMEHILHTLDEQCRPLHMASVDLFYIALYDKATQLIHFAVLREGNEYSSTDPIDLSVQPGLTGHVLRTGHTLYLPNLSQAADLLTQPIDIGGGTTRSYLGIPLIVGDEVIGVLSVQSYQPNAYSPDDIRWLETIAPQAAIAIENARLYAQAQRHAADLSSLYAITRASGRSLALEDVLDQTLATALVSFEFEGGLICLADVEESHLPAATSRLRLAAERGLPLPTIERLRDNLDRTLCALTHHQRQVVVLGHLTQADPAAAELVALGWQAYLGIPLLHHERSLGVLGLLARKPRSTLSYDLALLTAIGQQVGAAVANAQSFQSALNERSRLQAVLKSSQDGIMLNSLEGRILVINAQALNFLRLPGRPEDWLGRRFVAAFKPLQRYAPEVVKIAQAEIRRDQSGDELPGEGEFEVPPYTLHWLNLPVMVGSSPLGRLIVLRDVTEQRAVEHLREDMTHAMVHDLRNPLGNIFTTIAILRSGILGSVAPDQLAALQAAETSIRRMTGLVNAILDVNRLEGGPRSMPLDWQAFDLARLIAETLQAQTALASEKRLTLKTECLTLLPLAWGDPALIGRVLQNLVDNAVKFTPPEGQISVTARTFEEHERSVIWVSVQDSGRGIPANVQPRLFQKFVRGEQRERGSGLGLAFCKLAIEAHREHIWVESTSAQGTTITFSLATAPGGWTPI